MKHATDSVNWYMGELAARVVAESGIPGDRFHLGKIILRSLKDTPEFVLQIDAATGKSENFESVLKRSVQCAEAFKALGLKKGDVIVVMGANHLDLCIPMYAAFYMGIMVAALDGELGVVELESMLGSNRAKIIFCQGEKNQTVKTALQNIKMDARVVAFDAGIDCVTFDKFLEAYGLKADVDTFKAEDFDTAETYGLLTSTSGTTGVPKSAALTHKNMAISFPVIWTKHSKFPTPTKMVLVVSPIQWLSAGFHYILSPILRYTRLQSSRKVNEDHFYEIVNKYQPTLVILSAPLLAALLKPVNRVKGDLTCFEHIMSGGSSVPQQLVEQLRENSPKTGLIVGYGLSEVSGLVMLEENPVHVQMGKPVGLYDYKLVNFETKEEITEPNVSGELWLRGPTVFKGYYNNPKATEEILEEGGWLKTGDLFYRDEAHNLHFVDRLKMLLKYNNHQISPVELEAVIRQHEGVLDVAVTGLPDNLCGELPVACVVRKKGHSVTAQEIKDLVKNTLTDTKQLRGGVIFLEELPLNMVHKLHRQKLKEIAVTMNRE